MTENTCRKILVKKTYMTHSGGEVGGSGTRIKFMME